MNSRELRLLASQALNGDITSADLERLEQTLLNDQEARRIYREHLELYVDLQTSYSDSLAESAPHLAVSTRPYFLHKALAAAAVLLFLFSATWLLVQRYRTVAILTDAIDLAVAPPQTVNEGTRFFVGEDFHFTQGLARLEFDRGVEAILEGPCSFRLTSATSLALEQGRVAVTIHKPRQSFTVSTPHGDILDRGTAFGVEVLPTQTEVFVFDGAVELEQETRTKEISAGQAQRMALTGPGLSDIAFTPDRFVRRIDADTQLVWRYVKAIDLADLTAGGNGLGSGSPGYEIDPLNGRYQEICTAPVDRLGDHVFHEVSALNCVDGIFVPDGGYGPVQVSSLGHHFEACPDTSNVFFSELLSCSMTYKSTIAGRPRGLVLNRIPYGEGRRGGLLLHANLGITYDLDAIRDLLPAGETIMRFQSRVGISEETNQPHIGDIDVWVLLDGRIAYSQQNIRVGKVHTIDIPIRGVHQFLSLVVTDSGTARQGRINTFADWCVFGEPRLVLNRK